MEKDEIQLQLQRWLSRTTTAFSVRKVINLPIALASDVGIVRTENQDVVVLLRAQVTSQKSFLVGVLCDGMGGMIDGKGCAELAVSSFISSCIRYRKLNLKDRLLKAVDYSNETVYNKYHGQGGATLSAFILDSDKNLEAVNVGDSRIYIEANTGFEQVTTDDTIAGQLRNEFHGVEVSHRLLQHIGIGSGLEPHLIDLPSVDSISKILLTSDGAHYVAHDTLKRIFSPNISSEQLAKRLMNVANWCGGHDNASALVLTDLASVFLANENVHTGTIDVWDPFSDVQLIGIEKINHQDSAPVSDKTEEIIKSKATISSNTDEVSDQPTNTQKIKRQQKRKTKITPEKPNLRIDFDE